MAKIRSESQGDSIPYIQAIIVTVIASALAFPKVYEPAITTIWDNLEGWRLFRWSTFETLWTVFCYAVIELPMTTIFLRHPEWRLAHKATNQHGKEPPLPKGMRRSSGRAYEALLYAAPLLALDFTMIKKFADVPLEDMLHSGNYDASVAGYGKHRANFLVPSLHNFTLDSPLQTQRALPATAPSSRRLVTELIVSFILYDALFFLLHLAMHIVPVLKNFHRPHHSHGEIYPRITNQLSLFERMGLVLLANFSLNIIGSHVLTRTLFVPFFVWLLVEIHSGLDLPWAYDKILPTGWGGGARKHAMHHEDRGGGLEPYFNWCDALLEGFRQRMQRYVDTS